ncbi:ArsA family ATPase [Haladaptatus cibarius]|uniref:ArsA family ATPase n=1 Tax=Haladaptatus cibarius TaxID=453847 RepID=UPI000678B11D|nr:TRC40/GET3/ArsA family transport-energizing ATPase [Haladaptatus cibarius]
MAEIDVEAVERIDEGDVPTGIDAPEYVLYGGKGGVGKTTCAAATGLASARDGTRTLVVSTDPAHSLSDTFECEIPAEATKIREEIPLYAAEIDPDAALENQAGMLGTDSPLGGMLGDEEDGPMASLLGGAMPGADEAAAMQKLIEFLDDDRFDRVVVDTAPTGHTLRLLELPEIMDTMVGRIVSLRQRFQGMMDGMKGMFGGDADPKEGMDDLDAMKAQIERLRTTLRDPSKTDFRVVMIPEEMSVFESKRLLTQLDDFDIPVGTVVVNRVMENLADVTDAVDSSQFVTPNLDSCEFCQQRWDVQQGALREAQEVFRGHDIKRIPLFADEVRGEEMLRVVAACLE